MGFSPMTLVTGESVTTYSEYLNSEYWSLFKDLYIKIFSRSQLNCDCCGNQSKAYIELHHVSYENLGNMELEFFDVIMVCRRCHDTITRTEQDGFSPIEAIREARIKRLEEIRRSLELLTEKFHFELKRTPARIRNCKDQELVDQQVNNFIERGLLTDGFAKKYFRY